MEFSKFGRECKKSGGYFKCCVTIWRLDPFEATQDGLIKAGLVEGKKTKFCKVTKSGRSTCHFCSASGMCSKKSPLTGKVDNILYPENQTFKKGNLNQFWSWCHCDKGYILQPPENIFFQENGRHQPCILISIGATY